ncbi:hypothetical protein E9993_00975 [Labilibacter sediminis]|nr:hypothetical protein E9993_00975 [Labilibacter sediminis]
MHYTKHTKLEYLYKLRDITTMSIDDESVRNVVSGYGYDNIKLLEGKSMVEGLERLSNEVSRNNITKKNMFAKKKRFQAQIHKKYMKFLKLARIAFVNDIEVQEALMLTGARARTYDKWLVQVAVFIDNLLGNDSCLKRMSVYGVVKDDVQALRSELNDLMALSSECLKITGVVRMLNHKIKKETIVIQNWISSYIKVARIAMDENPQVKKLIKQAIGS